MKPYPTLAFSIVLDLIGQFSFLFVGVGEWFDILWAPISAYVFYKSFGKKHGKFGAIINFMEEILPFTDIIPTFTIAYFYYRNKN